MRWKFVSALALPFLFGGSAMRLAVAPTGDALGRSLAWIAPKPARLEAPEPDDERAETVEGELGAPAVTLPRRIASRSSSSARREAIEGAKDGGAEAGASVADAPKGTVFVPASVVTRALKKRDVAATNATAPDGSPLGARLAGVSKYHVGLRDGDVVVSVSGTRTRTVDAMVAAAMQAAAGGASRISGRIMRGGAVFAVVLELPK
jgi:hypothetical protein